MQRFELHKMNSIKVGQSARELLEAQAQVWNCTFNHVKSMSLKCAIQLGIPDIIHKHGQPMTLSQIVCTLDIHPTKANSIRRLMRILVLSGFFAQQISGQSEQEEEYSLTPSSKLLLMDGPLGVSPFALLIVDPTLTAPLNFLSTWFRNDDHSAFETAHGKKFWDSVADQPKLKNMFYDAMVSDSQLIARVLTEECKALFEGLKSVVDVGGGTGTIAKAIAKAFPDIQCTVLDLPHVVDNLEGTRNLKYLGGDMFKAIPPADAVLLKWIMHDWGDEECLEILKRCKEAIPSKDEGGKVIIIDMVIESKIQDKDSFETQLCFDMLMMSCFKTAKERSVEDWKKLFLEAGFSHHEITPVLGLRSIIEVYP